jgi:predicted RNA methylase
MVSELAQRMVFALEQRQGTLALVQCAAALRSQALERDHLTALLVERGVHHTHAAAAQEARDLIAFAAIGW